MLPDFEIRCRELGEIRFVSFHALKVTKENMKENKSMIPVLGIMMLAVARS